MITFQRKSFFLRNFSFLSLANCLLSSLLTFSRTSLFPPFLRMGGGKPQPLPHSFPNCMFFLNWPAPKYPKISPSLDQKSWISVSVTTQKIQVWLPFSREAHSLNLSPKVVAERKRGRTRKQCVNSKLCLH